MATYFITGGSGFVGRHLCRRLAEEGHTLRCAVRKTSAIEHLRDLGADLIEIDLTVGGDLRAALTGCDAIFHSAGLISPMTQEQLFRVNRDGTRFLCTAAAQLPTPPPLIYVSSIAAAGPAKTGIPKRPADFPKPVSRYGESKRAGERQLEMFADRVPTTIVRPGIIFGEGNRDMFPMFQSIRRFGLHAMPRADLRVSLIYVGDLIELLIKSLAEGKRIRHREDPQATFDGVGYYFAADEQQPTYQQLGEMVAEAVDVPHLHAVTMPKPLVWTTATVSELFGKAIGRPNILTRDKIREATAGDWTCDILTAVEELGFQTMQSMQASLCQTAQWYRDEGWM